MVRSLSACDAGHILTGNLPACLSLRGQLICANTAESRVRTLYRSGPLHFNQLILFLDAHQLSATIGGKAPSII